MTDYQYYIRALIAIGYTNDEANATVAAHISTGTIDMLERLIKKYDKDK